MGLGSFLVATANAPFTVALGITLLFALLQATGVLGLLAAGHDGDGEGDHDGGADADGDADADLDGDGDADADGGSEHDADHDGEGDDAETSSVFALAVAPLGFGKIPLSLIWQSYAMVFAATGLALNAGFLGRPGDIPAARLSWTVPVALLAGYAAVALIARLVGPIFSSKEQEATSRSQLVGHVGVVISSKVTSEFGEVRFRDRSGHDLRLVCRLAEGMRVPAESERVVVVEYEPTGGHLYVAPVEDSELRDGPRVSGEDSQSAEESAAAAPDSDRGRLNTGQHRA